jgi:hypothetical protein
MMTGWLQMEIVRPRGNLINCLTFAGHKLQYCKTACVVHWAVQCIIVTLHVCCLADLLHCHNAQAGLWCDTHRLKSSHQQFGGLRINNKPSCFPPSGACIWRVMLHVTPPSPLQCWQAVMKLFSDMQFWRERGKKTWGGGWLVMQEQHVALIFWNCRPPPT